MLNDDQLAVASFAADLAAGLNYVDKQTTNRPSQQPPALRTNPKDLITKLVQETRIVPSNQDQLKATVEDVNNKPVINSNILGSTQNVVIGNIQPITQNVQQLELTFDSNEKTQLLNTLKSIDTGIKRIITFLNDNCIKKSKSKFV